MRRNIFRATAVLSALLAWLPAAAAQEDGPEAKLIQTKAAAVVNVNFVLQITMDIRGQIREQERRSRTLGVVVDASGLVMVPAQVFEATLGRGGRGGRGGRRGGGNMADIDITAKPANIRVTFPGDDKEYAAILGAKDSKTGLAFVLIDDLGSAKPTALDTSKTAAPRVGQTLFGVSRLGQGFDHAPICARTKVMGKVTKPRDMWAIADGGQHVGKPLYTADGTVAGICAMQKGGSDNGASRPFLLPAQVVQKVIVRAKVEAEKSLQEIREARAEEEAESEALDEEKPDEKKDEDGEAKDDGGE